MHLDKKSIFGVFVFLLAVNTLFSQQSYFSGKAFLDSALMDNTIPGLAERLMLVYKKNPPKDRITFYNQLYRYEIVAGQYEKALVHIDSLRLLYDKADSLVSATIGLPIRIYALVKSKRTDREISFAEVFDTIFSNIYVSLSDRAFVIAENYFDVDLNARQANYLNELAKLRLDKRDSISFNEAKSLCVNYLTYRVYTMEIPIARPLLKTLNDEKYIIEDSLLINMRDGSQVSATIIRKRNIVSPQPVVLKFGIYASESEIPEAKFISAHGYIGIIADTRGKRLSKTKLSHLNMMPMMLMI
jgi:uncharacterized protein